MVSLDFRNQVRMKLKTYEYESILLLRFIAGRVWSGRVVGELRGYEFLIRGLIEANG